MSNREGGKGWTDCDQPKIIGYKPLVGDPRMSETGFEPVFAKPKPKYGSIDFGEPAHPSIAFSDDGADDDGGGGLLLGVIRGLRGFLDG